MKIIKGNHHISEKVLNLAEEIAVKHFPRIQNSVAIFQSTKDFILPGSVFNIPAITVGMYDARVTLTAHPFLEGIIESFKESTADFIVCISDKGKFRNNLPAVIAHELKHVEQNVLSKKTVAQSQSLAIKLKSNAQPPHEKDAKLFEEENFNEQKTIPSNYDWVHETQTEFEQLRSDFTTILDLFIQQRKLPENPKIFDKQPEGLNISIKGDIIDNDDLDFYIHNLRIALDKPITVTRDKSADLKRLKKLERLGLIKINEVKIEFQTNKKSKSVLPIAVWNHTKWDEAVWADENNSYDLIRTLIGKHNIKDAITLEAHLRNGFDYFITEDKDEFIRNGRRENLENSFHGLRVLTGNELETFFTG